MSRTFAIGDIHGHSARLEKLLVRLRARAAEGDRLVFVGDYIDRGPDSRGVVDRILRAREEWPGPVVTLMGNHEQCLLLVLGGGTETVFRNWMGLMDAHTLVPEYTAVCSLAAFRQGLPPEHQAFFRSLLPWHEDEHGIYVHAGVTAGRHPRECGEQVLLWSGGEFIRGSYDWGKPVVFGHTPQYTMPLNVSPYLRRQQWRPLDLPEKIGIDTGCGLGGPLTAVVLPEREFVEVR